MSLSDYSPVNERRMHQRGTHFTIGARLSIDGHSWKDADVSDLSSGGLLLLTDSHFKKGDELWLDLNIHGFFNEFDARVKAVVMRASGRGKRFAYGMAFVNLPPDVAIRIDENVKRDRPVYGTPYNAD